MAEVTNRLAEHCSFSYEPIKKENLNCTFVSPNKLTIKCSITVFTPVDRDENFPTAGFLLRLLRHVFSHLDVADCKLVPVRACCLRKSQDGTAASRSRARVLASTRTSRLTRIFASMEAQRRVIRSVQTCPKS